MVGLTSCVFVKSSHTMWTSWSKVLHVYSVIAQPDLGGVSPGAGWCRPWYQYPSLPTPRPGRTWWGLSHPSSSVCWPVEEWTAAMKDQRVGNQVSSSFEAFSPPGETKWLQSHRCYVDAVSKTAKWQFNTHYELLPIAGWQMTLLPWHDHPII